MGDNVEVHPYTLSHCHLRSLFGTYVVCPHNNLNNCIFKQRTVHAITRLSMRAGLSGHAEFAHNIKLNDLRKIICLRKSETSLERISVCNVTENLAEHGIRCLPCSYTNDDLLLRHTDI